MGPVDATKKPTQLKSPAVRRPVPPASARAYVPFVPPGKTSAFDPVDDGTNWTRLCGRTGFTAAGMGAVCMTVSLLTGGHGPAPYLAMPFEILGALVGGAGLVLAFKQSMNGWRPSGAAIAMGLVSLLIGQLVPMLKSGGATAPTVPTVVVDGGPGGAIVPSQAVADPTPAENPTPAAVPTPPPVAPALVTDQMILARANALLSAQLGFDFGPGWVAQGRSGNAAIGLSGVDAAGPQLQVMRRALPVNVSVVVISIDNTDGSKPIQIDPEFVKATTASGTTVRALSPKLVLSTATHDADVYLKKFGHPIDVAPGAKLEQAVIFFPATVDVTRLHGITFTVNGTLMTFRGHVMSKAEKQAAAIPAK